MLAAGMRPRFILREDWFWPVALDSERSDFVAERLQEHGVGRRALHERDPLRGRSRREHPRAASPIAAHIAPTCS
jgi:hypothetical protein